MGGIELEQLDELLRLGLMLAISGAGCPAATTTTSTDLSPISLTSASVVREEARIRFGIGALTSSGTGYA